MATCKECVYFTRCVVLGVELDIKHNKEADKNCRHFKNKADFVKVKHGKWIESWHKEHPKIKGGRLIEKKHHVFACSECGVKIVGLENMMWCPYCGAKMDGQKDGENNG